MEVEEVYAETKTIFQSFVVSIIIHLIFLVGTLVIGYVKIRNYTPDFANK